MRQVKAEVTIDAYFRAIRRIDAYFGCPPDVLTNEQSEAYQRPGDRKSAGDRGKVSPRGQALSATGDRHSQALARLERRGQALTYCGPIDNTGFFVTLYINTVQEKQNDSSKERTSQY